MPRWTSIRHFFPFVRIIKIGDLCLASIPAEYFTEFGLKIKDASPLPTMVVTLANGWLGYIPTAAALARQGGHETTITISSKMEPAAGDLMAEAVRRQIARLSQSIEAAHQLKSI